MSLVPLVEDELLTLPKRLSSPSVFSGVHILQSFIFLVGIVNHSLSICPSFGHCFNCPLIFTALITPLVSSNFSYTDVLQCF